MKPEQKQHPTGYTSTTLPLYENLDDVRFEEFCTGLLNLHPKVWCQREGKLVERRIVSASKLLSGTPQHGADIRAEVEDGEVWFFQCKRVKEFGSADVTEAIELVEQGFPHADQFVLVITRGLSEKALRLVKDRPKWDCWDEARLTMETVRIRPREDAINLVHRFFPPDVGKALFSCSNHPLLTWQQFFAADLSPERKQFNHHLPFVPWGNALKQLEDFAGSGAGRALVLSASGGQGKSRLLLELAKRLGGQTPRVRFLNLNHHGLTGEQSDFLAREDQDLLLIVDDAHRLDAAIEDVARATTRMESIRLLIATRPQALEAITSQLYQSGYAEKLEPPLCLPRWKPVELHKLAQQILSPRYRVQQAPRLADLADRCPLLVVIGGALINSGAWAETMTDVEAFRERVFRGFKEDFLCRQLESKRGRLDRLIRLLSFVSPAPKNEVLLNKAAEILGCSPFDVDEDLGALQVAGLVVENREGVRLYPDLFADAVLLDACLDHGGQPSFLHRTVLEKLPISDFPALMRNVAQADWAARTRKGAKKSLFEPIWREFVRRFEEGEWPDHNASYTQRALEQLGYADGSKVRPADRDKLLDQWAAVAMFLPERTIELAELAVKSVEVPPSVERGSNARVSVCGALPPLLKPVVIWHPGQATRALDLLWSLDAGEPRANWANSSNAIAAIADAASFAVHKPPKASETVIGWLEQKVRDPATVERLRRQPWVLSGLLKPFFKRAVEHTWSEGNAVHVLPLQVKVDVTRPLRQRALAIAEKFVTSQDALLSRAAVPVLKEAIDPIYGRFGAKPTEQDQEVWRPDRLEALKVMERAVATHRELPVLLLQLRRILWHRCEFEPDAVVLKECRRVLSAIPNTFQLRVVRVLTSFAHGEIHIGRGPDYSSNYEAAEKEWAEFRRSVAREVVQQFKTARELCAFLRCQIRELAAANLPVLGGALLDSVAEISPEWCVALLNELLGTQDATLDNFLWPLLHRSANVAPEAYREAVESLPDRGRPEQLSSLINYLGWKQLHDGRLEEVELHAIMRATKQTEESVVCALASTAGLPFGKQPPWAIEVLSRLKPTGERDARQILQALGRLAERNPGALAPEKVAGCLANLGAHCLTDVDEPDHDFAVVAKQFPKVVYEHVRTLLDAPGRSDTTGPLSLAFGGSLPLGLITDTAYVERELQEQWMRIVASDSVSGVRLALVRSLLWSDPAAAPARLQKLISDASRGEELKLAAKLAAVQGGRFVFEFPDLVRLLLNRGADLGIVETIQEKLWLSACGGPRSYTEFEPDPEYRYILEQGEALANRYHDDLILCPFYRTIADSERNQLSWHKRAFATEDRD